ncbi:MAG: hypothetical protein MUO76_17530 [Anaerolineaceae bacterium]|nr:hypothetical protein [Anaerolineaceae bacterium]
MIDADDIKRNIYKVYFSLVVLEGICALLVFFTPASMERSAFFLGYSVSRLAMGGGFFTVLLGFIWLAMRAFLAPESLSGRIEGLLKRLTAARDGLLSLTILLSFLFLSGAALPFVYPSVAAYLFEHVYQFFHYDYVLFANKVLTSIPFIFERVMPLYIWGVLLILQTLLLLFVKFGPVYREKGFFKWPLFFRYLLVLSVLLAAAFQWCVLYFHLDFFQEMPHWFWKFHEKETARSELLILILILLSLLAMFVIFKNPGKYGRGMVMLVILGYILQAGFGFIEKERGLLTVYRERGRLTYPLAAVKDLSLKDALVDYEAISQGDMGLETKPPGMLWYIWSLSGYPISSTQLRHLRRNSTGR